MTEDGASHSRRFVSLICIVKSLLFSALLLCETACFGADKWVTDLRAALNQAAAENKAVLVDFTGSDWCGWCIKLKKEVFDQQEFQAFADENLVLVEIDFPRAKQQSDALRRANKELASKFGIEGYPTVFILNANGDRLLQTGYKAGGPKAYIKHITAIQGFAWKQSEVAPAPANNAPRSTAPAKTNNVFVRTVPIEIHYDKLALKGILNGTKKTAIINNQSFAVGETAKVKLGDKQVRIECKEIRENSVLILAEGETEPRELMLKTTAEQQ